MFTVVLADEDPRLRDEATDWCIRNWRYVSKTRLKNIVRSWPGVDPAAFGEFTATVGKHAGITWPGSTEPRRYLPTGRSVLPSLDQPSLVWLRLRAMFGLGARTEILRYFLARPSLRAGVAEVAEATSYTKRNVAEESDQLQRAGVLYVRQSGNRFSYGLARRPELESFVGPLPSLCPDWTAVLRIASELVGLERLAVSSSSRTLPVKVRAALSRIEGDLWTLALPAPSAAILGSGLWPAVELLASETLGEWAVGRWPTPQRGPSEAERDASRRARPAKHPLSELPAPSRRKPGRSSLSATLAEVRAAERH